MSMIGISTYRANTLLGGTSLLAIAGACLLAGLRAGAASSDSEAVESVTRDYIEGWYTGDVTRVDRALHDDLVKRIPVHGDSAAAMKLRRVSKARMLKLTAEGGGGNPEAEFEIIVDDVATDIATARVLSPEYLDYLHLAKTEDGWKIVNVLFHTRE